MKKAIVLGGLVGIGCSFLLNVIDDYRKDRVEAWQESTMFPNPIYLSNDQFILVEKTNSEKVEECKRVKECHKLAEVVVWEARGESREGQHAVASVVLNRVDGERWPDTVVGVVHQHRQFSYLQDKHKQVKPTVKDWNNAFIVAYNLYFKEIERNTVADHYLAKKSLTRLPRWAKVYPEIEEIGNHTFYTSKR